MPDDGTSVAPATALNPPVAAPVYNPFSDPAFVAKYQQAINQNLTQAIQPPPQQDDSFMGQLARGLSNPGVQALMGLGQGFGQAAMPTRMPTPFSAVLGQGLGGMTQGLATGMQMQGAQNQQLIQQQQLQQERLKNVTGLMSMPLTYQEQMMRMRGMDPAYIQRLFANQQPAGVGGSGAPGGVQPSGGPTPYVPTNLPEGITPNEDLAVRTVAGEAGNQPVAGQQAVVEVMRNRMLTGNENLSQVLFKPYQFESWSNGSKSRAGMEALQPTDAQYQAILKNVVRPVFSGQAQDQTGGATYFYSPSAQTALGRKTPSFAQGRTMTLGDHSFYYGPYGGQTYEQMMASRAKATQQANQPTTPPETTVAGQTTPQPPATTETQPPPAKPVVVASNAPGVPTTTTPASAPVVAPTTTTTAPTTATTATATAAPVIPSEGRPPTPIVPGGNAAVPPQVQPPPAPAPAARAATETTPAPAGTLQVPGTQSEARQMYDQKVRDWQNGLLVEGLAKNAQMAPANYAAAMGIPYTPSEVSKEVALRYLDLANAGPKAFAEKQAQLAAQLQLEPQLAGETEAAKLRAQLGLQPQIDAAKAAAMQPYELLKLGYQKNQDGSWSYVPGLQNDPARLAEIERQKLAAQQPFELRKQGYGERPDGSFGYIPGLQADPAVQSAQAAAKANAEAAAAIIKAGPIAEANLIERHPIMTYKAMGPDNQYHEYQVPTKQYLDNARAGKTLDASTPGAIAGPPILTEEEAGGAKELGALRGEVIKAGRSADDSLIKLDVLNNARQYFTTDASGSMRKEGGRVLQAALNSMGVDVPDWVTNGITGAEVIDKEGGFLAAAMTKALGSREALQVFNQIRAMNPNLNMSDGGFERVVASIRMGLQRDKDIATFQRAWLDPKNQAVGGHTSVDGMLDAFNQLAPLESYASRVLPYPVPKVPPQELPKYLKNNTIYNTERVINGQKTTVPALWDAKQQIFLPQVAPPAQQ